MILFEDTKELEYLKNSDEVIKKIKNLKNDLHKKGFEAEQNGIFSFNEDGLLQFSITLRIPLNNSKPIKKSPSITR